MSGIPSDILCAADYLRHAAARLDPAVVAHLEGGSAADVTARANLRAFADLAIVPRNGIDFAPAQMRCTLGGETLAQPILLAPIGAQALYHPGAEREVARAAAASHVPLIASTQASMTLEDIAQAGAGPRWFQLYWQPDRAVTADLAARAAGAGYAALVLTLDTPLQMPSHAAIRAGSVAPTPAPNLERYAAPGIGASLFARAAAYGPTLDNIAWLAREAKLPIWMKGVLHPQGARDLMELGAAGIIVSNHGGRALDGIAASLTMLPAIRAALGEKAPILMDGGIRSGTDIFKAIARGADAVLIGRLQPAALGVGGALGVAHMLKLLREELEFAMAMAGCASLADVRSAMLVDQKGDMSC